MPLRTRLQETFQTNVITGDDHDIRSPRRRKKRNETSVGVKSRVVKLNSCGV